MIPLGRRTVMTLFSGSDCIFSHSCRFVLMEKDVECEIVDIAKEEVAEELSKTNPYNETPTLSDRELNLYGVSVINEYLEERLPHPPLMPIDPVGRAQARLLIMRFQREWLTPYYQSRQGNAHLDPGFLKNLREGLISLSPMLERQRYILGDEFGLADCVMAPLLWRLSILGIELPKQAQPVESYAARLFSRPTFHASLTATEKEMRSI